MNPIKHVAIIMDGNGRWGLKNKNSRNLGHKEGLKTVEKIINVSIKKKIKFLTLYAFSTENWKRPKKEINFLFLDGFKIKIKRGDLISKKGIFIIKYPDGTLKELPVLTYNYPKIKNASGPFSSPSGKIDFIDLIIGIPPATDASYSRLTLFFSAR